MNTKRKFEKKIAKLDILTLILMFITISAFSQWKTTESNNIKDDIVISYEVVYDKELSLDEKNSSEYLSEITVAFNKDYMVERRFVNNSKPTSNYSIFDYKTAKGYACIVSGSSKRAVKYNFKDPQKAVDFPENPESKTILEFPCEKGLTLINETPKDIYYTKKIGLKYCLKFKIEGFLLEYPGYSKILGFYTVKAKKIVYDKLPDSFYSLSDFTILTEDEYKKTINDSQKKNSDLRLEFIGKKAITFKDISIKQDKIDTKNSVGDIIVYNFWFTTCSPCKAEIPKLNTLKAKYKDKNIHFIAIALDPEYKITSFLAKTPFDYDILAEGSWLATKFDVNAYPTNIIVDKKGNIQFYEIGYKSDIIERMTNTLDKCLEQ